MTKPNSLCWNITNRCNDYCRFCYRDALSEEMSFEDKLRVIDKISEYGIYKLTFAGGEPLMVEGIKDLILYAKTKGIVVSLTTNAILLDSDSLEFVFKNVNWLTLSLDAEEQTLQSLVGRNSEHVSRVKEIVDFAEINRSCRCNIKINTVVCKQNREYIGELAEYIAKKPIKRWKLFQFVPLRGAAKKFEDDYAITDEEFKDAVESAKRIVCDKDIILSISDKKNIESAYFVIFPNGDIRVSNNLIDKKVGNVLCDNLAVVWENGEYNKVAHNERTKYIFE